MITKKPSHIKLDERDIKILSILQRNGRISKAALAERVNLSPTPCWERLKRLENSGVIVGYGAEVSLRPFEPVTIVFMQVEIESHRREDFERFESAIRRIPEVVECWAIGGGMDYICRVIVHHLGDYQRLVEALLEQQIGIKRYYTYVVTAPVKREPLPVKLLSQHKDQ